MKRKLWIGWILTVLIAAVCCGTALADEHVFMQEPVGGTINPEQARVIRWKTSFTPVKAELGYWWYQEGGTGIFSGPGAWYFTPVKEITSGLAPEMEYTLRYSDAVSNEKWSVRAYYSDTDYVGSAYFTISKVARQFLSDPAGGTLEPGGSLDLSFSLNFKPVKAEIGYYQHVSGGSGIFSYDYDVYHLMETYSTGLSRNMTCNLSYDSAVQSVRSCVRAYYSEGYFIESSPFTVTVTDRAFTIQPEGGEAPIQGTYKVSWQTNFAPVKQELIYKWTTTITDWFNPNNKTNYDQEQIIGEIGKYNRTHPCAAHGGLHIRAYYNETGYVDSAAFDITEPDGAFTVQPKGGLAESGDTLLWVDWSTNFTPNKLEFIRVSGNGTETVFDTQEGSWIARTDGSYGFDVAYGDQVNCRYKIRASYADGSGNIRSLDSDPFVVGRKNADFHFTVQPTDCYSVGSRAYVHWAVNFLPEKIQYLSGTGTDVSQYAPVDRLTASDEASYAIRAYYSVSEDMYCTSDSFTVTYYQDAFVRQPEGGSYPAGGKFHLTWELKFVPETLILRYCTPEGHPITMVPQFELDPTRSEYDMEIESGNDSQYYHLVAWLDDTHTVYSDPFQVRKTETVAFLQQPQDIVVPVNGSEDLTWKIGCTSFKTEIHMMDVGAEAGSETVETLPYGSLTSYTFDYDSEAGDRVAFVRIFYDYYDDSVYLDSEPAYITQESDTQQPVHRAFTLQPKDANVQYNETYGLTWRTNFKPVRTEIWYAPYTEAGLNAPSLRSLLDNPLTTWYAVTGDGSAAHYGYRVRAYYTETEYLDSAWAHIYQEAQFDLSDPAFLVQPQDGFHQPGQSFTAGFTTNFVPIKVELSWVDENGDHIPGEGLPFYRTFSDLGSSMTVDVQMKPEYTSARIRVVAWYDQGLAVLSDPFRVSRYAFTAHPESGLTYRSDPVYSEAGLAPTYETSYFHAAWETSFTPTDITIFSCNASGEPEDAEHLAEYHPKNTDTHYDIPMHFSAGSQRSFRVKARFGAGENDFILSDPFTVTMPVFISYDTMIDIPAGGTGALHWQSSFVPEYAQIRQVSDGADPIVLDTVYPDAKAWTYEGIPYGDLPDASTNYQVVLGYAYTGPSGAGSGQLKTAQSIFTRDPNVPIFLRQPTCISLVDETHATFDWTLSFEDVKTEILRGGEVIAELEAGQNTHTFEESEESYTVRAYYSGEAFVESNPFSVAVSVLTFRDGYQNKYSPKTVLVLTGSRYTLPKCLFPRVYGSWGYAPDFTGWRIGEGNSLPVRPIGYTFTVTGDTLIRASWTSKSVNYHITFHAGGGDVYVNDRTAESINSNSYAKVTRSGTTLITLEYDFYLNMSGGVVGTDYNDNGLSVVPPAGRSSLPDWSGYGPVGYPDQLSWKLIEYLNTDMFETSVSQYEDRGYPGDTYYFPLYSETYRVEAYPIWGNRYSISFDLNGGTGAVPNSTVLKIPMGGTESYKLPQCSATPPSGYTFGGWKLGNEVYQPGYVFESVTSDMRFKAVWKNQREGFYLYGEIDGETVTEALTDYWMEARVDGCWTLRIQPARESYVGVMYFSGDYGEENYIRYSSAHPGENSAVLTDRGGTPDTASLLKIPGRTSVRLVLTPGEEAGSYLLESELPRELHLDTATTVDIDQDDETVFFRFVPSETAAYRFFSTGAYETQCTLYDADMGYIQSSSGGYEEYNNSGDGNFDLYSELTAGETYFFGVRMYSAVETGRFTVQLTKVRNVYLYGIIDGQAYGCGGGAADAKDYPFSATSDPFVYSLRTTFAQDSYVAVREGNTWYSAASNPGNATSATLTDRGETSDPSRMLRVPGQYPVTLRAALHQDGSVTLSYERLQATELQLRVAATAVIESGGDYAYFTFVPEKTGTYTFCSTGDGDTYGYLYSSAMEMITEDDDGGEDTNFSMTCELTANTLYIFGARFYNRETTGSFPVLLVDGNGGEGGSWTVTFDSRGGTAVEAQTVADGTAAEKPADPVKIGQAFNGWFTDAACTEATRFDFAAPIMHDMTLYAGWYEPRPNGCLKLPAGTVTVEEEAFLGVAAEGVIIPKSVQTIANDAFDGSAVVYIYGYAGTEAEAFVRRSAMQEEAPAENSPVLQGSADENSSEEIVPGGTVSGAFVFVAIDDAWMAGHE